MMSSKDKNASIKNLDLNHHSLKGKLWSGAYPNTGRSLNKSVIKTGYQKLDESMHLGGWPLHTSTELGLNSAGIGELRLLTPALRALVKRNPLQTNVIWVAPPFIPFAPGLIKEGIKVNSLTVIQTNNMQDTLWAAEQALLAESCAAVFAWTGRYDLSIRELRRLQLAAEKTSTWNVLFRDTDCLKQASASGLRIHLQSNAYSQLDLHIIKQPQGWGGQRCTLSLHPHYESWQRLTVDLLPHRNQIQTPHIPEQISSMVHRQQDQANVTVLSSFAALKTVH